ncbi:hypothetical protein AVEN_139601-1 [Araneus ventricosus]|uniref:Secreted protein n=1 Tax=Araneus ventricosus TaxID=182803 RepID=A0A4Y2JHR5_ARAVE|nr:hypothetical protein AVEN_139601-1 [Araneus ventricosus]
MQLHKLFFAQLLVVLFQKPHRYLCYPPPVPDLGKDKISLTIDSIGYCLRLLNVTFDNTLRPKLLPNRSEGSLGNPSHGFPNILRQDTI